MYTTKPAQILAVIRPRWRWEGLNNIERNSYDTKYELQANGPEKAETTAFTPSRHRLTSLVLHFLQHQSALPHNSVVIVLDRTRPRTDLPQRTAYLANLGQVLGAR